MNAPEPPNPYQTAAAQAATNAAAANQNAAYLSGANNFVGPSGTQTSAQTGTRVIPATYVTNKKGKQKMVSPAQEIPIYTQTTTLSPAEQQKLDLRNQFGIASGQLGNEQLTRLSETLKNPLDTSAETTGAYLMDLWRKRMDPMWDQSAEQLRTKLRNQGLQESSDPASAWMQAMGGFQQGRNDAYNQFALTGHQQGVSEQIAQRNQQINESLGLATGIPLSQPQFNPISGASVSPVDLAALQANNYATRAGNYQAMAGALGAMGGAGVQAAGMYASPGGWLNPGVKA